MFCMGKKFGVSSEAKNIDCGCLCAGCWGESFDLRGRMWLEKIAIRGMKKFTSCTLPSRSDKIKERCDSHGR
jgi:hypothetical protein